MYRRVLVLISSILAASSILLAQISNDPMQPGTISVPGAFSTGQGQRGLGATGSITGSLVTMTGSPVREARVELHDSSTGTVLASGYTAINGSFQFDNVPSGQYEVVANRGVNQATQEVRVDSGPAEVTLRVNTPQAEPGAGHTVSVTALRIPEKAMNAFHKAAQAFQKGKFEDAEKHVLKALEVVPNYAQALTLRGLLKFQKTDVQGGEQDFQQAIRSDPNYDLSYFAMGAALNSTGQFLQAQKALEEGLKINPVSWQGYFELSKALLGQHDFRNALKNVVKAESCNPPFPAIHLVKAHALLGLKDYEEATQELERYLTENSTGPEADQARQALNQAKAFSATASR